MSKFIGFIMFLVLLLEIGVAVAIVAAAPGGFGGLVTVDIGPERRQILDPVTYEVGANATGKITLEGDNGRVDITGDPNATAVTIKATKVANGNSDDVFKKLTFEARKDGNDIIIRAKNNQPVGFVLGGGNVRVDVSITAPISMIPQLKTDNGTQTITNFKNETAVYNFQSENGRLIISQVTGKRLELKTDNGSISLDAVTAIVNSETNNGRFEARNGNLSFEQLKSDNGSVTLSAINGNLNIETSNGRIDVSNSTLSIGRIKADNGSVNVQGTLNQTANGTIETNNGSITLKLDKAATSRYDISTNNGKIAFNVPGVTFATNSRNNLVTNGNGPILRIKTENSGITISG